MTESQTALLQTLKLTVILSVPVEYRLVHHDAFMAHVYVPMPNIGQADVQLKLARREAVRLAQAIAADEYGLTLNEGGRFGGVYVFSGHQHDMGG